MRWELLTLALICGVGLALTALVGAFIPINRNKQVALGQRLGNLGVDASFEPETDVTDIVEGAPRHLAFIVDGNGRWAQSRGLSRSIGHARGASTAVDIVKGGFRGGAEVITLYLFSTENWKRPPEEVRNMYETHPFATSVTSLYHLTF